MLWYKNCYRRNLVDMHIDDWDKRFLSKIDPKYYVELLELSKTQSAQVVASSHTGNCMWPTKVGHMHNSIRDRDILGEIIEECHKRGIYVTIYYSVIFNNWAYNTHPEWRIMKANGREGSENYRYKFCCPNSEYRDFSIAQLQELCEGYDFEGIFLDMTHWLREAICYCKNCQERFKNETGYDSIPTIIDWDNPQWIKFQEKREEWITEFANLLTLTVKRLKPNVSVQHQYSTCIYDWRKAVTIEIAEACDYIGGDFYGDLFQESFINKLYYNLTPNHPHEFITTTSRALNDHTTLKSKELLKSQVYLTLANYGGFLFIDPIDPIGTQNRKSFEVMGEIFNETRIYEKYIGGSLCQDVGVYFSFESKFNPEDNSKNVLDESFMKNESVYPHLEAALNSARSLLENHIPWGIITKKNLNELSKYQIIVLPNVLVMDEEEVEALRNYVKSGGSLYVSCNPSVLDKTGTQKDNLYFLRNFLGVSFRGKTNEKVTYISPVSKYSNIFPDISTEYPIILFSEQIVCEGFNEEDVIAKITLPFTNPKDPSKFASIHSNPPGKSTEYPSIILRNYGEGKVLYITGPLEAMEYDLHRKIFINLLKKLSTKPFYFEIVTPKCVEMTLFNQEENKRFIICLFNHQYEIPISEIKVRIRLNGKVPKRLIKIPDENLLDFQVRDDLIEFNSPILNTFLMFSLEYH